MLRYLSLVLAFSFLGPPGEISQARKAFDEKRYADCISFFEDAAKSYPEKSTEIWFNIGQCWLAQDSVAKALDQYGKSLDPKHPGIASLALNNSGVIHISRNQKAEEGIAAFKEALRRDPGNELARYNLELALKQQQQKQDQQKQDQQNQDQNQEKDQQDQQQQQDKKDQNSQNEEQSEKQDKSTSQQKQKSLPKEGKGQNAEYKEISEEQAKMILEGMKENEKQFLQQLRKSPKTKPENDGKPAW